MAKAKRVAGKYKPTAKEIMEEYYCDLWARANSIVEELIKVQNKLVKMLPAYKEKLPKSFEKLAEQKAQICLSDYIRLRSLYDFAKELRDFIENQCRDLAKKHIDDIDGEKDSETALCQLVNAISAFPFEEVANDSIAGILRFNENYTHKCFRQWMGNTRFESWRCDVMGGIRDQGLQCDWLWRDAVADTIPTCSNIGELLSDN